MRHRPAHANRRRVAIIGSLAFAGLAAAGMATAAVLLTTTVTGSATINTIQATTPPTNTTTPPPSTTTAPPKPAVAISATGNQQGGLDCRQVGVSADYKTLTFKPVLTRVEGEPAKAESCTVTLKVRNTGNTLIHLDASATQLEGPNGWTIGAPTGDAVSTEIKPAEVKTATIAVTATPSATTGDFRGQLVYADGS